MGNDKSTWLQILGFRLRRLIKFLADLLENDFVTRAKYEDDARSTRIFLTQKGLDVRNSLEDEWEKLEEQTIAGLTDTETLMLRQLLVKLAVEMG